MMRVAHVTSEVADKTLTIPTNSMGPANADIEESVSA